MLQAKGFAATSPKLPLAPHSFHRRDPGPHDVVISIEFCGVCHSDIHQARDEWGGSTYPMIPGHEIVGTVTKVGAAVQKFKPGDKAGVGCFVDSCRTCSSCREGTEQYCEKHLALTYNGTEMDEKTPTQGGYSDLIVVNQDYVLRVPTNLDGAAVAPLLCAGITTWSPLRHWGVGRGHKLGVVGLGGLGHMAVKFGASFGAEVTVISTSPKKADDARRLGAKNFINSRDEAAMGKAALSLDFIIDTVAAPHDVNAQLGLLKTNGTLILVGIPEKPIDVHAFSLVPRRRRLVGSMIGGIRETQEMLDHCGKTGVVSDIEKIPISKINEAYERTIKGDVRYRFVIDMATLGKH